VLCAVFVSVYHEDVCMCVCGGVWVSVSQCVVCVLCVSVVCECCVRVLCVLCM